MTADQVAAFKRRFPTAGDRPSADHPAFDVPTGEVVTVLRHLRDELGFLLLMDLTAIDAGPGATPRFTVVYHLLAPGPERADYVRIAAPCTGPEEEPLMPSVVALWPGANWHERECWDLFGIKFSGHPDLRRILMWEGYPYHPLRKEFPLAGLETDLPVADIQEETGTRVVAAPMAGGPFVASSGELNLTEAEPRGLDQSWSDRQAQPGQTPLRQVQE